MIKYLFMACVLMSAACSPARSPSNAARVNPQAEPPASPRVEPIVQRAAPPKSFIRFFYLVNESGRDVEVRISADEKTLVTEKIAARVQAQEAAGEVPPRPRPRHPARELKISLDESIQWITVEELRSGLKDRFRVPQATGAQDAGFRITILESAILLARDYYSLR